MRRRSDKLPSNTLIVSSSRSSFSLSRLSPLSDLWVCSERECEPELLHSGRDENSSSRKRAASPLLNSSDMLRATSFFASDEKGKEEEEQEEEEIRTKTLTKPLL